MTHQMFASIVLSLSVSALSAQALAFDVALDPTRLFLRHVTETLIDSGPVAVPADNSPSRPFMLPCNLAQYGVQIDVRYRTGTLLLYPQLQSRYYTLPNALVWSNGYNFGSNVPFSVVRSNVSPFTVGQTAVVGQMSIDSLTVASRNWQFQPGDLSANMTVRHALHVSVYSDSNYTIEAAGDVLPLNNSRFVYIRRVCPN